MMSVEEGVAAVSGVVITANFIGTIINDRRFYRVVTRLKALETKMGIVMRKMRLDVPDDEIEGEEM